MGFLKASKFKTLRLFFILVGDFLPRPVILIDFITPALYNGERRRGVAQLVEHYLREVGAACSNHVTPIREESALSGLFFLVCSKQT